MARPRIKRSPWLVPGIVFGSICAYSVLYWLISSVHLHSPYFRLLNHVEHNDIAIVRDVPVATPARPVTVPVTGGEIHANPAPMHDVSDSLGILSDEFDLYPPELAQRLQPFRVVLCTQLSLNGDAVGGLADVGRGDLYLDISYLSGNQAYLRSTIHHEFFHLIDYRINSNFCDDPEWEALNKPGFHYSGNKRSVLADSSTPWEFSDQSPGFITHYSMTGVEEDKAEVFAFLIMHPKCAVDRIQCDPVLQAKVRLIKARLAVLCPNLNDDFWVRVNTHPLHCENPMIGPIKENTIQCR